MPNIIFEGPDSSGKSTLSSRVMATFGGQHTLTFQPGQGPPKSPEEMISRIQWFLSVDNCIFDRHPCVSQPIYGSLRNDPKLPRDLLDEFYDQPNIFIYCRTSSLQGHEVKSYEKRAHVESVRENFGQLVELYDIWATEHRPLIYIRDTPQEKGDHRNTQPGMDVRHFVHQIRVQYEFMKGLY